MIRIETELPEDIPPREALLDRCFGRARFRKTCERLRRGRLPAEGLAFALRDGPAFLGTVRLWSVTAGSAGPALLLGPIAIAPERQGDGLGGALMRHALGAAVRRGHRAVILVGDQPYYARFGFAADAVQGLALPGPVERGRFLGRALMPGALDGATGLVVPTGARRRASADTLRRAA